MSTPPFSPRPLVNCPACQGPLKPIGRMPIRHDIAQAGIIVLAQPGDQQPIVGIDAYRCHNCGRLDFYDHDYLLPSL